MGAARRFEGRVALVTGGARGIGQAIAAAFAAEGASVAVADVRAERAEATAAALGPNAFGRGVDVSDEASVAALFSAVDERFGRLDYLVNNAAIMLDVPVPFKPFWETSLAEWRRFFDVNVSGIFLCCRAAQPFFARQGGGRVVNISSDAIYKGYESQLAYFASKGAVAVMTRNLARELGPFQVNVNAVAPGLTNSEAVDLSADMQRVKPLVVKSQALQRDQRPEDVASAVLFLCSEESACVTGQSLVVNCGAVMP